MLSKNSTVSGKVTARADSTGMENDRNVIVKHHHSVKKMQTPTVSRKTRKMRKSKNLILGTVSSEPRSYTHKKVCKMLRIGPNILYLLTLK